MSFTRGPVPNRPRTATGPRPGVGDPGSNKSLLLSFAETLNRSMFSADFLQRDNKPALFCTVHAFLVVFEEKWQRKSLKDLCDCCLLLIIW